MLQHIRLAFFFQLIYLRQKMIALQNTLENHFKHFKYSLIS